MTDFLAWALVLEVIGLAFLPLTVWAFRWLPDRGYAFAKILGLLLVTYATWLVGNVLSVARSALLPAGVLVVAGILGWSLARGRAMRSLREVARVVAVEEVLFLAALLSYSLLRAYTFGADIAHTEQPMDMAFLSSSIRSASYPPYDPWMSGHPINYYYFGYLMVAMLVKLSGVTPFVGYNLGLSWVFAAVVSGAYGVGFALTRRLGWAFLAPIFLAVLGNWHALLWTLPHSGCPGTQLHDVYGWLWESTRVVGGHFTPASWSCNRSALAQTNDYTINEYPLFSFVLGDLHPHLTALPGTLLALAFGCNMLFRPRVLRVQWNRESVGSLALMSIAVGALFTMNSWDFPTYLLILAACIAMSAYITNSTADWWKEPAQTVALLAAASLVLFAPFYIHFRSLAHGVGRVTTPTNIYEFIQVFGLYLLGAALLIGALHVLLRPAVEEGAEEETAVPKGAVAAKSERGATDLQIAWVIGAVTAIIVLGGVLQRWVLLLDLGLASWALTVLYRVLNTERPNRSDALTLTLVAVAALVLAFTELFYLRDVFDGSSSYRMNTVFKFYYQAWTLLSLAAAYGSYRGWRVLRDYFSRSLAWGALVVLAVGVVGAGIYTRYVPAYAASSPASRSLNGIAWLRANHPDDDAAIQWLRSHASGDPVVLEAPGDEYAADTSRIATFSGLPTVIGWSGHENQWRPGDGDIGVRVRDVNTIYSTTNVALAEQLMRRYGVGYVVVGDFERACPTTKSHCYPRAGLAKFHRFMRAAYTSGTTTVFRW